MDANDKTDGGKCDSRDIGSQANAGRSSDGAGPVVTVGASVVPVYEHVRGGLVDRDGGSDGEERVHVGWVGRCGWVWVWVATRAGAVAGAGPKRQGRAGRSGRGTRRRLSGRRLRCRTPLVPSRGGIYASSPTPPLPSLLLQIVQLQDPCTPDTILSRTSIALRHGPPAHAVSPGRARQ